MIPLVLSCHPSDAAAGRGAFAAAELERAGLSVRLDARPMDVAARFWPPLKSMISNKLRAQAWAALITDTVSLDNVAVETLGYAASGAKGTRGQEFALIALRPGSAAVAMPGAFAAMQQIAMGEPTWARSVRGLAEGRGLARGQGTGLGGSIGEPYSITLHHRVPSGGRSVSAIELRPLTSSWLQFFVAVPWSEVGQAQLRLVHGLRGTLPEPHCEPAEAASPQPEREGEWAVLRGPEPASRRESYFLFCDAIPTTVRFGVPDGHLQYTVRLRPV